MCEVRVQKTMNIRNQVLHEKTYICSNALQMQKLHRIKPYTNEKNVSLNVCVASTTAHPAMVSCIQHIAENRPNKYPAARQQGWIYEYYHPDVKK